MDDDAPIQLVVLYANPIVSAAWPQLLCTIVSRIETIAHNDFPIPVLPPPRPAPPVPRFSLGPLSGAHAAGSNGTAAGAGAGASSDSNPSSQEDTNKENTNPAASSSSSTSAPPTTTTATEGPIPNHNHQHHHPRAGAGDETNNTGARPGSSSHPSPTSLPSSSPAPSSLPDTDSFLPPQIADLLNLIITTLTTTFAQYPPYTIQRLAELVLAPRQHYRSLASYLHAVDRVISVTSCSNIYPLPPAVPDMSAMSLLANGVSPSALANGDAMGNGTDDVNVNVNVNVNGTGSSSGGNGHDNGSNNAPLASVGSDEALGGALLTPIPWLRRRPTSSGDDDNNTDDGSSPPSSSDSGDLAFSAASSASGGVLHRPAGAASPSSALQQQQQPDQQQQQQQQQLQLAEQQGPEQSQQQEEQQPEPREPRDRQEQQEHQRQLQAQQQQQPQPQPQQHRMEVRTETTETIEGPNGMGSIETVSVSINGVPSHGAMAAALQLQQQRGVTQGELLRQEQKAGVVPVSQLARAAAAAAVGSSSSFGNRYRTSTTGNEADDEAEEEEGGDELDDEDRQTEPDEQRADAAMSGADVVDNNSGVADGPGEDIPDEGQAEAGKDDDEEEEERPHARGPEEIGAADMGPQPANSATGTGTGSGSAPSLLRIGSIDDAHRVDVHELDMEAAVGRKAAALPVGTVAAAVVPSREMDMADDVDGDGGAATTTAGDSDGMEALTALDHAAAETAAATGSAAPTPSPARSGTPKRDAEEEPAAALPAKRRKEDHGPSTGTHTELAATADEASNTAAAAKDAVPAKTASPAQTTTAMVVDQPNADGVGDGSGNDKVSAAAVAAASAVPEEMPTTDA
ncbi:Protein phosphatase 4 core regulatory subunit R2 [Niveomyces insectorum RCEF 264]|uniref:Protein phosphatase 4 core regulatory subunit R2 n=1 Tax=Niveomyces insectorum RCEF 264 TaxID=1081102 RepID=A0A167Y8S9_9HYPO|nr:Protein phosphatase 4 core regulatory subunit R2 [Niveomyces insectorum RCEF 264]